MKKLLFIAALGLFFMQNSFAQLADEGAFGVGLAYNSLTYGVSAKYNFTDVHTAQVIVGAADYGFGAFGNDSSFAISGRYIYNFEAGEFNFAEWQPYAFGELGYLTYSYDNFGVFADDGDLNAVTFSVGGGVEFSFFDFIDGLTFNTEIMYTSGSFDFPGSYNIDGSFSGIYWGGGIHYYFN